MEGKNLLAPSLVLILISILTLGVFAGNDGYYCDPKTKVCYPTNKDDKTSSWHKKDSNIEGYHKYKNSYKFFSPHHTGWKEHLKLTDKQDKSISALLKEYETELEKIKSSKLSIETEINDLLLLENPDFTRIENKVKEFAELKIKIDLVHLKYYQKIYNELSKDQKEWVVSHLKEKSSKAFTCPVSDDKIKDIKSAPSSTYKGKTYHFCCPDCKKEFDKNPEKYIK